MYWQDKYYSATYLCPMREENTRHSQTTLPPVVFARCLGGQCKWTVDHWHCFYCNQGFGIGIYFRGHSVETPHWMEKVTKVKLLSEGTRFMHNDISLVNLMFFPCLQVTLVNLSILKTIWEGKKRERKWLSSCSYAKQISLFPEQSRVLLLLVNYCALLG